MIELHGSIKRSHQGFAGRRFVFSQGYWGLHQRFWGSVTVHECSSQTRCCSQTSPTVWWLHLLLSMSSINHVCVMFCYRPWYADGSQAAAASVFWAQRRFCPTSHQPPQQCICAPGNIITHVPGKEHVQITYMRSVRLSFLFLWVFYLPLSDWFFHLCSCLATSRVSLYHFTSLCSLFLCQFNHFSHFKMTIPQFYRSSCLSLPVSTPTPAPCLTRPL